MPSAIVKRGVGDLDADHLDLGPRADLMAIGDAAAEPAAADGDDDLREIGHVLEQLEAERALPRNDRPDRRTGGRTRGRPPALAPCADTRQLLDPEPPPTCTIAPCPRAASALAIGASAGTKTSHGTPIARAAAASACAWLPAEAATTPLAQPSSPSAASLAAVPRTLKEPVLWRFSALSTTVPPRARRSSASRASGVRRAAFATAGRAASTSRAETEGSTVATP